MEFCSDAVSLGREDRSKHVGSNALDGSENDAIYDDEMPEVADDVKEDELATMTKNFNCIKFAQTKRLL